MGGGGGVFFFFFGGVGGGVFFFFFLGVGRGFFFFGGGWGVGGGFFFFLVGGRASDMLLGFGRGETKRPGVRLPGPPFPGRVNTEDGGTAKKKRLGPSFLVGPPGPVD